MPQPDLDAVLECCWMMEWCRERDRRGETTFDLGAIVGECDWHEELCLIIKEWRDVNANNL